MPLENIAHVCGNVVVRVVRVSMRSQVPLRRIRRLCHRSIALMNVVVERLNIAVRVRRVLLRGRRAQQREICLLNRCAAQLALFARASASTSLHVKWIVPQKARKQYGKHELLHTCLDHAHPILHGQERPVAERA